MNQLYQELQNSRDQRDAVLATVISGEHVGEKMLLLDGEVCGCSGPQGFLRGYAAPISNISESCLLVLEGERVFCEKIGGRKILIICGAGHVSIPMIEMGKRIGFYVIVIEDRPAFAERARAAGADTVLCDSFEHALAGISGSADSYFVIVTRGHQYDRQCLKLAVQKPNAYVGMMGSRKRVAVVKEELQQEGTPRELLDQVCMPIGLDIGAETPEEIAVSVIAQIIQKKNEKKGISVYDEKLLRVLAEGTETGRRRILATVIAKDGSAPRDIGTKMLVLEDGTAIGTIGGGYVEGRILQECLAMIRREQKETSCMKVAMSKENPEADMACGGSVEVFLEPEP